MALSREQKKKILENLREKISRQKAMIFVEFKGVKVKDLFDLRKKLKKSDSQLIVAKKTLFNLALKEAIKEMDFKKMDGEIALAFGFKDEISPAKIIHEATQQNKNLKILGGFVENKLQTSEEIIALAQLPGRQELLAKLVGSVAAPLLGFINVLQGNIKGLLVVLAKAKA